MRKLEYTQLVKYLFKDHLLDTLTVYETNSNNLFNESFLISDLYVLKGFGYLNSVMTSILPTVGCTLTTFIRVAIALNLSLEGDHDGEKFVFVQSGLLQFDIDLTLPDPGNGGGGSITVINNLNELISGKALDATQGRVLKEQIIALSAEVENKEDSLGYTPVPTARTITINGTTLDLSANRSFSVPTANPTTDASLLITGQLNDSRLSSNIVRLTSVQTLSNKTLTSPIINTPVGITKADVGLSQVDNTPDTTKPVSTPQATAISSSFTTALSTIRGGVVTAGDTLSKLYALIQSLNAIVTGSITTGPDADSLVNTVSEILAVFATYPEGVDVLTALNSKVNTSDIVNSLGVTASGKVLDARQGKVLSDAITALSIVAGNVTLDDIPALLAYVRGSVTSVWVQHIYSGGLFFYISGASTVDNALVYPAQGGGSWVRWLVDRRITPQMFGAKGDFSTDDAVALQAWLNKTGSFEHYLPVGVYLSSTTLTRTDLGAFTLQGSGSSRSRLLFTGNTDGLKIVNTSTLGSVSLKGFEINSTFTKTSREGLVVTTQETQRPGPLLDDIIIRSSTTGQEWLNSLRIHDCVGTSVSNLTVNSFGYATTTGIKITNTATKGSYEHKFSQVDMKNVKLGVDLDSATTGTLGIEGIQITDMNISGCFQGIKGITAQNAPYISLKGVNITAYGGECLYLDGYKYVNIDSSIFNSNASISNADASRAIYFNNINGLKGSFDVKTTSNTANAVELSGVCQNLSLTINATASYGQTNVAKVFNGCLSPDFYVKRTWLGSLGTNTGVDILDLSGTARKVIYVNANSMNSAINGSILSYDTTTKQVVIGADLTAPAVDLATAFTSGLI